MANGVLYTIRDSNYAVMGYLFGTYHFTTESELKFSSAVTDSLDKAKTLCVECLPADHPEIAEVLANEEDETTAKAIQFQNYFFAKYMKLKPGADAHLVDMARKKKMAVVELETAETQLKCMKMCARLFLKDLESGKTSQMKQEVITTMSCWESGILYAFKARHKIAKKTMAKEDFSVLYPSRNKAMVEKIDKHLREGALPFVAIGVNHLVSAEGDGDGLVDLLTQKGWTLTYQNPKSSRHTEDDDIEEDNTFVLYYA